jgi:hypothetical protein
MLCELLNHHRCHQNEKNMKFCPINYLLDTMLNLWTVIEHKYIQHSCPIYDVQRSLRHTYCKKYGSVETFALVGCSIVWVGLSAMFRDHTRHILALMETIHCPKMSVTNQSTLCNNLEEQKSQLPHGNHLKSGVVVLVYRQNDRKEHTYY